MRLNSLLILAFTGISFGTAVGQSAPGVKRFVINGQIVNRDTGFVALWYNDEYGKLHQDSFRLENGKFTFSGSVNGVCESLLWTDLRNRNFDDPTVIRFLLEPKAVNIYKKNDQAPALIQGSESQKEKESWDRYKSSFLAIKERYFDTLRILNKATNTKDSSIVKHQINQVGRQRDSINRILLTLDLKYIKQHPGSYLSGYLLSNQKRRLPVDTLERLYSI